MLCHFIHLPFSPLKKKALASLTATITVGQSDFNAAVQKQKDSWQLGSDGVLGWLRYVSTKSSGGISANKEIVYFLWWAYVAYIWWWDFLWSYYENHVALVLDVLFFNGLPSAKRCREKENVIWWDMMISFLLDVVRNSSLRKRFHLASFLDSIYRPKKLNLIVFLLISMLSFPFHFLFSPSKLFAT